MLKSNRENDTTMLIYRNSIITPLFYVVNMLNENKREKIKLMKGEGKCLILN